MPPCYDTVTHYVIIDGEFAIYAPNAFTPNGDGLNDYFFPQGIGLTDKDFTFLIFDRWGEIIFESHRLSDAWDGTARSKTSSSELVPIDVYVWKIIVTDNTLHPQEHEYVGRVTVVR